MLRSKAFKLTEESTCYVLSFFIDIVGSTEPLSFETDQSQNHNAFCP